MDRYSVWSDESHNSSYSYKYRPQIVRGQALVVQAIALRERRAAAKPGGPAPYVPSMKPLCAAETALTVAPMAFFEVAAHTGRVTRPQLRTPGGLQDPNCAHREGYKPAGQAGYIFLTRAQHRERVEVWPIQLRDTLPTVPVPLRPPEADVPLNLTTAIATIYDEARYDLSLNYRELPDPPLEGDDAA